MSVKNLLGISVLAACAALSGGARAETTVNNLLSVVNVNGSLTCGDIDIKLNRPVTITGDFPIGSGTDLTIRVEPLATTLPAAAAANLKEAASVAPGNISNLSAAVFDPAATNGPIIHLTFSKAMAFHVLLDNDNRHVRVAVSPVENAVACLGKPVVVDTTPPKVEPPKTDAPETDQGSKSDLPIKADAPGPVNDAAGALKEGKKSLTTLDYARATAYFTKAVTIGTGTEKQEAQEMLGLSRERAGQMAFARAEYETYLKLYPNGAGVKRVKDRLNGVMAAMEDKANEQFALRQEKRLAEAPKVSLLDKANTAGGAQTSGAPQTSTTGGTLVMTQQGMKTSLHDAPPDPKAWVWDKHGSFAQYYYRDDNFSQSVPGQGPLDLHTVPNNEVLTNGMFYIRGENQDYSLEADAAVDNQEGFGDQSSLNTSSLSTLYADARLKGPKLGAKLGRQSRSSGGVFGRFDGGDLSWEPLKDLKAQTVVGSPVYGSNARPFADGRYFYGVSLDYTLPSKDWAGGVYAIEQDIQNIIDRRAIGGELRYSAPKLNVYSAADYDIFYSQLNNAYLSGTWNPRDGTSVYATADYRKVPFLLTSNALSGENFGQLSTLVDAVGQDAAYQWAALRTASSETLTLGGSQEILKDWQLTLDATIANYSGTPPSGSQTGFAAPGIEYYLSAQVNGSSLFRQYDSLSMGLRYSASQTNKLYMTDASYRFAVNDKLRLVPRIRLSLSDSNVSGGSQTIYRVIPSMKSTYRINKKWSIEAELGVDWKDTVSAISAVQTLDILASAGYRYDF